MRGSGVGFSSPEGAVCLLPLVFLPGLFCFLVSLSGMVARCCDPLTMLWGQKMHLGWSTHPAWKHLACGYWRFEVTELSDDRSRLFHPSSERLELRSLRTGLKVAPDCFREGCTSAKFLHRQRLTAASMHLATTMGGSTRRCSVLPVSVTRQEVLLTTHPTRSKVQRSERRRGL